MWGAGPARDAGSEAWAAALGGGRGGHFELLSFYNMDARLLKSCFGTYSEFIFLDFMTDLLVVPFCQLMF